MICNLGDPMSLRHPVLVAYRYVYTLSMNMYMHCIYVHNIYIYIYTRSHYSLSVCVAVCCSVLQRVTVHVEARVVHSYICEHWYVWRYISGCWYEYVRVVMYECAAAQDSVRMKVAVYTCTWLMCIYTDRTRSTRVFPLFKQSNSSMIQGCDYSWDPLSCRSFFTKGPPNIGHFCGKWPIKIRDPMSLRHPVLNQRCHTLSYTYTPRMYTHIWAQPLRVAPHAVDMKWGGYGQ